MNSMQTVSLGSGIYGGEDKGISRVGFNYYMYDNKKRVGY